MIANNQLLAREATAAKMLDMTVNDFRELVASGCLPKPLRIGGRHDRWSVEHLKAISTGTILDDKFEW